MLFVDVILPLALPNLYTYGVPIELQEKVIVGCRVEVQFGKRKIYSAIIKKIHSTKPESYNVKPIRTLIDDEPIVTSKQLQFWEWIANYYMCTEGEVMNAALPAHLKLISETKIMLNTEIEIDSSTLTDDEFLIIEALKVRLDKAE